MRASPGDLLMKRYLLLCLTILFSLLVGYQIVCIWRGMVLSQKGYTKDSLLRGARLDPFNPDPFHKLGLLHQWNLLQVDLKESVRYFRKAIQRNPLEQEYWLHLARVLQRMGERASFERALENAILVFPTSYRGRWVAGNLLLHSGDLEKALPHFSYILSHYPNQSSLVYEVWLRAVGDADFLLERLIPGDPSSLNQYLAYLYGVRDTESAKRAWAKLMSLSYEPDRREIIRHIDFLISSGELTEASQIWNAKVQKEESSDGNLITNGGFERETVLGGGFDWRIGAIPGAEISFDHSVAYEGKSSLRITFKGEENLDFHHVYQFVALKPDTDYVLRGYMKTEAITTKSGLKMEVVGVGPSFQIGSESLTGDNGWKELTVNFHNPARSQGVVVRVRRVQTDKFDRFISGTVWIDKVKLSKETIRLRSSE
jgi:tetratricopeptide (TPR) repeat protein